MAETASPRRWPRAVVFDLDGTLVDSAPDISRALNSAFSPYGVPPFATADVNKLIGGGAMAAIERATVALGMTLSKQQLAEALERFYVAYRQVSAEGNGLFPGVHELMGELRAAKVARAVCTNKAESVTAIALDALGITHWLDAWIGASDHLPKKPHPAMLHKVLDDLKVPVADSVFVGDSPADFGVARAAGCPVVLVDFGYTSIPVREIGADAVISHLSELPAAMARLKR